MEILSQLSRRRGWLLSWTLLGALFGPAFFTSSGTQAAVIELGIAEYRFFGALGGFISAYGIRLSEDTLKCAARRFSEPLLCIGILLFLLYVYIFAYQTLAEMRSRSGPSRPIEFVSPAPPDSTASPAGIGYFPDLVADDLARCHNP